jgi:hypothetical protein
MSEAPIPNEPLEEQPVPDTSTTPESEIIPVDAVDAQGNKIDPPKVHDLYGKYEIKAEDKILSLNTQDNYYGEKFGFTLLQSYYTDTKQDKTEITKSVESDEHGTNQYLKHTLQLPLPSDLQDMFSAKWNSSPFDKFVENSVRWFTDETIHEEATKKYDWSKSMSDMIESGIKGLVKGIADAGNRQLGGSEANIEHIMQRQIGSATNNNDSIFFEGHGIDSFTLSFDIVPLNKSYYDSVTKILKAIILDASADLSSGQAYWSIPGNFSIRIYVPNESGTPTLFYQRNYFKIKSINTNFNTSGLMTFHKGGELVKFNVKFECMDVAMISKTKRRDFTLFGSKYGTVDYLSVAQGGSAKRSETTGKVGDTT